MQIGIRVNPRRYKKVRAALVTSGKASGKLDRAIVLGM
jgi:hypothetical protein